MSPECEAKVLSLIGLGVRGRMVVVGVEQVRQAAIRGRLAYAVLATGASRHSRDKVVPLLTAKRIPFIDGPDAARLGAAVGKESTAAVGIVDRDLARGIRGAAESSSAGLNRRKRF